MKNISDDTVKAQLNRILSSSEFIKGERLGQFLSYVVEQTLDGHAGKIKQYSVALEALGYGVDFDPQANPVIRIEAQRLRRALDKYYSTTGLVDPIRIEIPKGGYVPVFVDNFSAVEAARIAGYHTPEIEQESIDPLEPAVAVVMFENLDQNEQNAFFSTGLTAEILFQLARFSGLSVIGPLSKTRGEPLDYEHILKKFGALFVLQGWIRCDGLKIRVTTDLTDTSTGKKEWINTFEYDLEKDSLFEIEDQIASRVTGVIADGAGVIFKKLQSETYLNHLKFSDTSLAVLKYQHAMVTLTPQDWENAIEALHNALQAQPANALLLAMLANCYYADALFEMNLLPDSLAKLNNLVHEAVSLDPELQFARYNLVVTNAILGRPQKCVAQAKKVLAMNPNNSRVVGGCAVAVTSVGEYRLGLQLIERAKRLNPHYPSWYNFVNYLIEFHYEQYDSAWAHAQLIQMKGNFFDPLFRVAVLGKLGRIDEADASIRELFKYKPDFLEKPLDSIRRLFVLDRHVEMIWDGLCKAGVENIT